MNLLDRLRIRVAGHIESFVQRITVVGDKATLIYVMPPNGLLEEKIGVCLMCSTVGGTGFEPVTPAM
jgi:hypothetical protein